MIANLRPYLVPCLFFNWILVHPVFSQQLPDSTFYRQSLITLQEIDPANSGPDARIYTGAQYIRNGLRAKGFPYFQSEDTQKGSVYYSDAFYPNVEMQYDLAMDAVIINDYSGTAKIRLVDEKTSQFSILGHHFLYMKEDASFCPPMTTGFFELLYNGGISLYGRYEKQLVFPSNLEDQPAYHESDFYFLKIKNVFYRVSSKSSLLGLLKDKKDLLKKFIRQNGINFKALLKEDLVKTVTYYDQIKD